MGIIVSKKHFAELIGKDPRWISKLIEDGMPIKGGGGRGVPVEIDSEMAINWLIDQQLTKRIGDSDEDGGAGVDEEKLLKRTRRKKIELEIDAARKKVIPFDATEAVMLRIAAVFGTQLDTLASRTANEVATLDDPAEIHKKQFAECRRIRAATAEKLLSEVQALVDEVGEFFEVDGEDSGCSAVEDGE